MEVFTNVIGMGLKEACPWQAGSSTIPFYRLRRSLQMLFHGHGKWALGSFLGGLTILQPVMNKPLYNALH